MVKRIDLVKFYQNMATSSSFLAFEFSISKNGLHLLVGYYNNPGKLLYIKLESPFCFTNFKEVIEQDFIDCYLVIFLYSDDGRKLFVSLGKNKLVYQYTLTTPYDVTTMTNKQNIKLSKYSLS